ncbi:MAG: GtrA family protein [Cellvibrionaceae bacterium]|nr:GtrA family protein [Cellvibrionaceae bacterium]
MSSLQAKLDWPLLRQLARFALVGIAATLTHYLVSIVCLEQLDWNVYLANLAGYCSAVGLSFVGHAKFTFRAQSSMKVFSKFALVSLAALGLSELLLMMLEAVFDLPHRLAMLLVVATIPVFTFIASRLWVYAGS